MAARKKKAHRRRSRRELVCNTDFKLATFNPTTGKRFKKPMCVPHKGNAKPRRPHPMPKPKVIAMDCRAGAQLMQANPNTGRRRPTCVRVLKNGKVKTHAPTKGKKSRSQAVRITKIVAVSGRR